MLKTIEPREKSIKTNKIVYHITIPILKPPNLVANYNEKYRHCDHEKTKDNPQNMKSAKNAENSENQGTEPVKFYYRQMPEKILQQNTTKTTDKNAGPLPVKKS